MSDNALVKLDAARAALAECKTVMEVKQIADMAEAARVYLERTQASVETVNKATEIRLLAERQMGEFLKEMPKNPGGNPKLTPATAEGVDLPKMAEIGITYQQSSRAQKLADIPAPEFHARIQTAREEGKLTTNAVLRKGKQARTLFSRSLWEKQAQAVMTSWLQMVPEDQRGNAAKFLSDLPTKILSRLQ